MALRLTPSGYQKVLAAQGQRRTAAPTTQQPDGTTQTLSQVQQALTPATRLSQMAGMPTDITGAFRTAGAGLTAAQALQNFQAGRTAPGAFQATSAVGQGLQLLPKDTTIAGLPANQLGAGLGTVGSLAGMGYNLAGSQGPLTEQQAGGAITGGLQGASSLANLAPASWTAGGVPISQAGGAMAAEYGGAAAGSSLSSGLSGAAGAAGVTFGVGEGLAGLLGDVKGYDQGRAKTLAAVQMVGAAAAPFTLGLSALVAPILSMVWKDKPSAYQRHQMRSATQASQGANQLAQAYGQAAQSGDPAKVLAAFQSDIGDGRVRSGLHANVAKEIGLLRPDGTPKVEWNELNDQEFMKVLDYFAEDPSRLTAQKPTNHNAAITGSGDVPYLKQDAAEEFAAGNASSARQVLQSMLLRFGQSPKLDQIRTIMQLRQATPEQLAQIPDSASWAKDAINSDFDPWSAKEPMKEFREYPAKKQKELDDFRQQVKEGFANNTVPYAPSDLDNPKRAQIVHEEKTKWEQGQASQFAARNYTEGVNW